jgi:hypothetical protein
VTAPPLQPSDRIRLAPAATRALGADLLVNAGGATAPVERLSGNGPALWQAFGRGLTIEEAAVELAASTGVPVGEVEPHALAFAGALVRARLAEAAR